MKYARVKHGIFKVVRDDGDRLQVGFRGIGCDYISKRVVVKQSDSIEELLDKFVISSENGEKFIYDPFDLDGWIIEGTLYGAIWTERGLIYVAKLNDKGEWELL